jgi:hypothetical protein
MPRTAEDPCGLCTVCLSLVWDACSLPAPCLLQCWAFSACVSLITAVTSFMQRCHDLPTDWEVHDVLQQPAGPNSAAAQAALRQLAAAGGEGSAGDRCAPTKQAC